MSDSMVIGRASINTYAFAQSKCNILYTKDKQHPLGQEYGVIFLEFRDEAK